MLASLVTLKGRWYEAQVATITEESGCRTEMVQAQAERETSRSRLTRAEFLDTLEVEVRLFAIADLKDPRFARAFELVNKSNQFNTTGHRWTQEWRKPADWLLQRPAHVRAIERRLPEAVG